MCTTLEERIEIARWAQAGDTEPAITAAIGQSLWTLRKWRRRYQAQEQEKRAPPMGRAPSGASAHFPPEIRETLRQLRQTHPGWGPETLRPELEAHQADCAGWSVLLSGPLLHWPASAGDL